MNVYDTERLDIIKRYEKLKQKYDDREDLRKDFPDAYERICKILKYLKVGYEYTTIDITEDCLKAMGALMCGAQQIERGRILAVTERYQKEFKKFMKEMNEKYVCK